LASKIQLANWADSQEDRTRKIGVTWQINFELTQSIWKVDQEVGADEIRRLETKDLQIMRWTIAEMGGPQD